MAFHPRLFVLMGCDGLDKEDCPSKEPAAFNGITDSFGTDGRRGGLTMARAALGAER